MHLIHPMILKIGVPVLAALVVVLCIIKNKTKYVGGRKAANTEFVKRLDIYQARKRLYTFVSVFLSVCILAATISSLVLVSRLAKKETVSNGTKKRDIFLCMDVSYSLYELNYDLVESLEGVVAGLDGDRFGISIYNTSTVLYVPMTDDYDFVISKLEDLKTYFELQKEFMDKYYDPVTGYTYYDQDEYDDYSALQEKLEYYDAGTLVNNYRKGSSLIGEGLASCMYSFPRLEDEDRTRIIIMSTDNSQEAITTPLVQLEEASDICKKNDIKVFGIFPSEGSWSGMNTTDYDTDERQLKECVEKTGGIFYKESESLSVDYIVKDIQRVEALEVEEVTVTKIVDQPRIPVIVMMSLLLIIFVVGMVIKV